MTDQSTDPAGGSSEAPSRRLQIGSQRASETEEPPQAKPALPAEPAKPPADHARKPYPPPNTRAQLTPELEQELRDALGDSSIEALLEGEASPSSASTELVPESRTSGSVIKVHRDDVFIELGQRHQGIVPLKQFDTPPAVGEQLDLIVVRFDPDEGLYNLSRPMAAVEVGNWDDVEEGQVVEVAVTGHNKGGLECEVAGLRGFVPLGQISIYRVENAEEYVGQRLSCVVIEANRERRNLVLSHRALMERERAEKREQLIGELEVGQVRDGVVRSLREFGAFVDLGGVDGLVHISQMSWDRVNHPSEVFTEGQRVKVRVEKVDRDSGKIGLSYRETTANPWDSADEKYQAGVRVDGVVTKLMDFGAFVKLEPGIEGLIHVSEMSHGRVWRPSDVVQEGQQVEVKVLSIDRTNQRISLSLKALLAPPAKADQQESANEVPALPADAPKPPVKRDTPLKGGLGGPSGGEQFGLKW